MAWIDPVHDNVAAAKTLSGSMRGTRKALFAMWRAIDGADPPSPTCFAASTRKGCKHGPRSREALYRSQGNEPDTCLINAAMERLASDTGCCLLVNKTTGRTTVGSIMRAD